MISLALNLMQEQVMEKVNWIAREIGLTGDGNTNEEVVKITKEDRLKQTPADMTGNELDFNQKRVQKYEKNAEEDEINEEAYLDRLEEGDGVDHIDEIDCDPEPYQ